MLRKTKYIEVSLLIGDNLLLQHLLTWSNRVLTMHFLQMRTDRNDSAVIEVYDGDREDRLLARVKVRNGTLPQSVTSTRENLFVKFMADPLASTIVFVRLSAGYSKYYISFQEFVTNSLLSVERL